MTFKGKVAFAEAAALGSMPIVGVTVDSVTIDPVALDFVVKSKIYDEDRDTMYLTLRGGGITVYDVSIPQTPTIRTRWVTNEDVEGQDSPEPSGSHAKLPFERDQVLQHRLGFAGDIESQGRHRWAPAVAREPAIPQPVQELEGSQRVELGMPVSQSGRRPARAGHALAQLGFELEEVGHLFHQRRGQLSLRAFLAQEGDPVRRPLATQRGLDHPEQRRKCMEAVGVME